MSHQPVSLLSLCLDKVFQPALDDDDKSLIATVRDILLRVEKDDLVTRQCLAILWKSSKRSPAHLDILCRSEDTLPRFVSLLKTDAQRDCFVHGLILKFLFLFMKARGDVRIPDILVANFSCILMRGHFPLAKETLYTISYLTQTLKDLDKIVDEALINTLYVSLIQYYRNLKNAVNSRYNNIKLELTLLTYRNIMKGGKCSLRMVQLLSTGLYATLEFILIRLVKEVNISEKNKILAFKLLKQLETDENFMSAMAPFPELLSDFKQMQASGWLLDKYENKPPNINTKDDRG